jgi:hypothetical protein
MKVNLHEAPAKIGRPAFNLTWPQDRAFTLKEVANRRKNIGQAFSLPGLKARALRDLAAGVLEDAGTKARGKGQRGRPQRLFKVKEVV